METQTLSKLTKWLPIVAALLVCAAYANHFQNSFHFDDIHTIVDNPAMRSLRNVPRFFTDATTFSVLPPNRTYRPVLSTSLAVDYWLGGYGTFWFHVTSFGAFLGQLGCMYLLFVELLQVVCLQRPARVVEVVATVWYGVHPAVAETVNYIIQRGDIFSTLGVVAALVVFLRLGRWRWLHLLPLALGLLSKPPAAVFPVLLLAYLLLFEEDTARRPIALVRAVGPSVVVTAALLWFEGRMTPRTFVPSDFSYGSYLLAQPYVAMRYFWSFFLPVHLNVDTDLQPFHAVDLRAVCGVLFLCGTVLLVIFALRRPEKRIISRFGAVQDISLRPIAFGLVWFLVGLLPTSFYRLSEVENDHRMYLPFVGLALAVTYAGWVGYVWLASRLGSAESRDRLRVGAIAGVVVLLSAYGYGTHVRNKVWRTEETLWLDDVEKSPANGRGLMIYGLTQMEKGEYGRALDYFIRAERLVPAYATLQINLGVVYGAMRDTTEAERHFGRALTLAPADDLPHLFYGRWLSEQGRTAEAILQLKTALLLNPSRVEPHELLASAYAADGDFEDARAAAEATLAIVPGDEAATAVLAGLNAPSADAWLNRSLGEYRAGRYAECIVSARRALALKPDYAEAYNNIGAAYAAMRTWDAAVEADRGGFAVEAWVCAGEEQSGLG